MCPEQEIPEFLKDTKPELSFLLSSLSIIKKVLSEKFIVKLYSI
jgi:hypothetical protein